jgi:sugar lactone lactonase YvrE
MKEADIRTFIDGSEHNISKPSGLVLHDGILYVSDYTTGIIYGFSADDGTLIDWLDLKRPRTLGGLEMDARGNMYVVDTGANEIVRISSKEYRGS